MSNVLLVVAALAMLFMLACTIIVMALLMVMA